MLLRSAVFRLEHRLSYLLVPTESVILLRIRWFPYLFKTPSRGEKQYFTHSLRSFVKYCFSPLEDKIHIFAPPCNILYINYLIFIVYRFCCGTISVWSQFNKMLFYTDAEIHLFVIVNRRDGMETHYHFYRTHLCYSLVVISTLLLVKLQTQYSRDIETTIYIERTIAAVAQKLR